MCRNIKQLFNFDPPASHDEIREASVQYVRKISGTRSPAQVNTDVFDRAVDEVAAATASLLAGLVTSSVPKNREEVAAAARARAEKRYGAQ
ncbi:MAG: DUF2277 domain-containing protein [Candidatus Latescibacteria bacterium]|jgi:hypothetical protein|nr:DUF2277 domain-containing protein [Candidatus Latescibacterota bacterium]